MYNEVHKWLKYQSVTTNTDWLRTRMESHPDYPGLLSVQDSLEELGIKTYACVGTKDELKQENKPFLAHLNVAGGHIVFCRSVNDAEKIIKDFDKVWSGNVMFIEKPGHYGNPEHDAALKKEKRNKTFASLALVIAFVTFTALPIVAGNSLLLGFMLSGITGLYLSWLIVQKEFGISSSVSDKICSMAKHSRCESVLHAKGAKLFNWLTWGDVGITYFTASLLLLGLYPLTNQSINLYQIISVSGMVFPFYSLYYQWRVVKQWCMLCIGVLIVLAINAIIASAQISVVSINGLWKPLLAFILISAGTLAIWQLLKYLYGQSQQALQHQITALRLKRNPQILNALLDKQEIKQDNLPQPAEPLRFGNPAAPYQLVVACNPYCGPCAKAHHAIENLYEKYPDQLNISIRFALSSAGEKDSRTAAAIEILKAAVHKPYEAVKDWYKDMKLEKFKLLHHSNGADVSGAVVKHIQWSEKAEITATPTVFINGRKLPDLYNWMELTAAIEYELK
jgi:protein-disulfide isomerase